MQQSSSRQINQQSDQQYVGQIRHRKRRKAESVKITLTIPQMLLDDVDATAKRDYTTRSDVIRQALVDYIRQYSLACGGMEPEKAMLVLRRRLAMADFNKMFNHDKIKLDDD